MEPGTARFELELECPCCGNVGAVADADGMFVDGQALVCICLGHVSCDWETEPYVVVDYDCGHMERA